MITDSDGRKPFKVNIDFEGGGSYIGYVWAYTAMRAYNLSLQDAIMGSTNPQQSGDVTYLSVKQLEEDDEDFLNWARRTNRPG